MSDPQTLDQMLVTLSPAPQGECVLALVDEIPADIHPFAVIRDDDMFAVVLEKSEAEAVGLSVDKTYAHLSLGLQADLDSIDATAITAQVLSACSIVADPIVCACHDRFFAQVDRAAEAAQLLIEPGKNARDWLSHN